MGFSFLHSQEGRRVEVLHKNVPPTQTSRLFNVLPRLICCTSRRGSIHVSIGECLPNRMILISGFGNVGLLGPHPLGEDRLEAWVVDRKVKIPCSRITACGALPLFLPGAGSWVTHRTGPQHLEGLQQKCQWSYLHVLNEENKV